MGVDVKYRSHEISPYVIGKRKYSETGCISNLDTRYLIVIPLYAFPHLVVPYISCSFEIVMANEILDGANMIVAIKAYNQNWSMCQSHLTALHV